MERKEIQKWLRDRKAIRTQKTVNQYWWGQRISIEHSDGTRYQAITIFNQMDDENLNLKGYFNKPVVKYLINGKLVYTQFL